MLRLRGTSLLETIVAAVLFLTVFAVALELLPRLSVRDDDPLLVAEADYRIGRTFERYATGIWPCGNYTQRFGWGEITVEIACYDRFTELQVVTVTARIDGSRKRITHKQLVECSEQNPD